MKKRFHLLFFSHSKLAQCFSDECHGQSPADHCHIFRLPFLITNSAHIPEFKTCTKKTELVEVELSGHCQEKITKISDFCGAAAEG